MVFGQKLKQKKGYRILMVLVAAASTGLPVHSAQATCLRPTVYFKPIADQAPYNTCNAKTFLTVKDGEKGRSLKVPVCPKFAREAKTQGQASVTIDGYRRVINVADNTATSFKIIPKAQCSYGYGVQNLCLVPFVSIAADLKHFDVGDVLYVDGLKGTQVPDPLHPGRWWSHDGHVVVTDRGGSIKGSNRFDFFIGTSHWTNPNFPWRESHLKEVNPEMGQVSLANPNQCKFKFKKVNDQTQKQVLARYSHLINQAQKGSGIN